MLDLSIKDLRKKIDNNEISIDSLFKKSVNKAKQLNDEYNSFVTILDDYKINDNNKSVLYGIPYALKDNFSTKGILTTGSSNILSDYIPIYDSTVYKKLKDAGALLVGKTVLDELAMGGTGTTGHTGIVRNALDKTRMIGGSSAGSANAVALNIVPFAIGSDTGDSVRKPACYGGLVGFIPTYGRISRYGLFPFASSLDRVGVIAKNVYDVTLVTDVIKGHDDKDMTSLEDDNILYQKTLENDIKGKKLFYIKELIENISDDEDFIEVINNFKNVIDKCKNMGFEVYEVSVSKQLLSSIYPCYNIISCAEATSNNANLTGILYGPRSEKENISEMIFDARTKGFSELIKRRFVIGSYVLQKENQEKLYLNACRVRRMIVENIGDLFKKYDALILPTTGGIAPKFNEKEDKLSDKYLILENHMQIANFGGFPSITIPSGTLHNMPLGINISSNIYNDALLLNIANKIENKITGVDNNV